MTKNVMAIVIQSQRTEPREVAPSRWNQVYMQAVNVTIWIPYAMLCMNRAVSCASAIEIAPGILV